MKNREFPVLSTVHAVTRRCPSHTHTHTHTQTHTLTLTHQPLNCSVLRSRAVSCRCCPLCMLSRDSALHTHTHTHTHTHSHTHIHTHTHTLILTHQPLDCSVLRSRAVSCRCCPLCMLSQDGALHTHTHTHTLTLTRIHSHSHISPLTVLFSGQGP